MKKIMPVLRSMPVHETLQLPSRVEMLPKIESGEIDHLDFQARVYGTGKNRNPYVFKDEDLYNFANSFEGQPFLRNHDTYDIDARDGTIIDSALEGQAFKQTIRLTTRRGMTDFIEGKIDRFSIGWFYDDVLCSICNESWFSSSCSHSPGRMYKVGETKAEKMCQLIFVNPKGKETSAVNTPAVEGTGIEKLQEYKFEVIGELSAVAHAKALKPLTKGGQTMKRKVKVKVTDPDTQEVTEVEGEAVELSAQEVALDENRQAAAELLGESQRAAAAQAALDAQLAASQETHVAMCDNLLTTGLSMSRLPDLTQARIRKGFAGRVFKEPELALAIQEAREEVSALTAPGNVQGPGRAISMFDSRDQFRLAVEDLFGVERDPKEADIKVHRLRGIQDAYLMATGDQQFMGGFYPEFALVTANFPGIVANVMNKMLIKAWKDFENVYGWWKEIVTIEHFTYLNQVTWVKTGTIASLPSVAERGEYLELPIGDTKETSDWGKYGGYVPLTIEAVLRDDLRAFTRMPREAALAGIRNISEQVAYIFTQASGAGPTMTDTGALFNSTAQTTAGGHLNLLTTALGTDYAAWNAVATAMYKKKMMVKNAAGYYGIGKPYGMKPNVCLVPADLITQAEALFIPRWASIVEGPSAQIKGGYTFGGKVKPLAVPDWTDATDWAAVNTLMPGVMLGEIFGVVPQIFSASSEMDPAMFANDESRLKVRQFLAVGVADDMPLAKNNVA